MVLRIYSNIIIKHINALKYNKSTNKTIQNAIPKAKNGSNIKQFKMLFQKRKNINIKQFKMLFQKQ